MAPKKVIFMQETKSIATAFARALEAGRSLANVYTNRGYGPDGNDPIVAVDLSGHEVEPLELLQFVTFITALETLGAKIPEMDGYNALLDRLRTDR